MGFKDRDQDARQLFDFELGLGCRVFDLELHPESEARV